MMTKKLKIVRDGHGGILRGGARPLPTTRVATVIRNELRAALDVEPFGVAALASVERVAKAGRALLLATSSDIAQQIAATAIHSIGQDGFNPGYDAPAYGLPLAPAPPAETFGVKALNEMVAAIKKQKPPKTDTELPLHPPIREPQITLYELQSGLRDAKQANDLPLVKRFERALAKRMDAIDPPEKVVAFKPKPTAKQLAAQFKPKKAVSA